MASLDLGLIGDCALSALIDRRGTVPWSCFPRFDGDPLFCRLLDGAGAAERGFFGVELERRLLEGRVEALAGYRGDGPVRHGNQAFEQDRHDGYGSVILAATQAFFDTRPHARRGRWDDLFRRPNHGRNRVARRPIGAEAGAPAAAPGGIGPARRRSRGRRSGATLPVRSRSSRSAGVGLLRIIAGHRLQREGPPVMPHG